MNLFCLNSYDMYTNYAYTITHVCVYVYVFDCAYIMYLFYICILVCVFVCISHKLTYSTICDCIQVVMQVYFTKYFRQNDFLLVIVRSYVLFSLSNVLYGSRSE